MNIIHNHNGNNSSFQLSRVHITIWLIDWTVGAILSFITLLCILASFKKLIRLEFVVLLIFSLSTVATKISGALLLVLVYFWPELGNTCLYAILNIIAIVLVEKQAMVSFYYSLFQISTVSREKLFLALYNLVHNPKVFAFYEAVVSIVLFCINGVFFYLAYRLNDRCPNINDLLQVVLKYKLIILIVAPSFLSVVAYIACTVYICYLRFIAEPKNSKYYARSRNNEHGQFRKHLRLILKFLALALIFLACSLFQNLFFIYTFIYGDFSTLILLMGHAGFVLYAIRPLLVIFIHAVLKESFKSFFLMLFAFIKRL